MQHNAHWIRNFGPCIYIHAMRSKPLELPPDVARRFLEDMRAFFAEKNGIKRDEIAARQLQVLRGYQPPGEKRLRLFEVKEIFLQMRDQA
jgi:hypothetical protein